MRVAGRQKGAKIKPYTHVVVNPNAPKSRYTFSMHSSESRAKAAAKKYSPLVGDDLKVVKQSGKSPSSDMFEATKRIQLMPMGTLNIPKWHELLDRSIEKYKDYVIRDKDFSI